MMKKFLFLCLFTPLCFSQENYIPSKDNIQAREWFQDAKFGLFIHWGVYSVLGDGEWAMNKQNISISEYNKLATFFNPAYFDADQWVLMAKDAGMKYITITSRHHDGFSMFDSAASDYNIIDKTPYGKDVLKMLSDACRKQGIKLFFYYFGSDFFLWDHISPFGTTFPPFQITKGENSPCSKSKKNTVSGSRTREDFDFRRHLHVLNNLSYFQVLVRYIRMF